MKLNQIDYQSPVAEIVHSGWKSLIKNLGVFKATRFLHFVSRGFGDSVKDRRALWGNKNVREIDQDIIKAKKQGLI